VVARKDHLLIARRGYPDLPVRDGLLAAGFDVRRLRPDEIPFQFDSLLKEAETNQKNGNYRQAAEIYEYICENYQNQLWMKSLAARAFFDAGNYTKAADLVSWVNQKRPTVDTLLLEARLKRKKSDFATALSLLETARDVLRCKILSGEEKPLTSHVWCKI
jgi:tetratricopeptide (TPR) repeat protein